MAYKTFVELAREISEKYKEALYPDTKMIYHYTDLNGLLGILGTNGFWATNYSFLNDKKEIIHGIEICEEIIKELELTVSSGTGKYYLSSLKEKLKSNDQDIFIVSFCSDSDLLSQWRGYSQGQQGVAIGFDFLEIHNYSTPKDNNYFFIDKVIYNKGIQRAILKDIIDEGLKIVIDNNIRSDSFQAGAVNMALKRYIALFKDDSFQEESEWRFVATNYNSSTQRFELKFRVRGDYILPYVELPLKFNQTEEKNLPIKELIVAPPSKTTTVNSLKYMLREKGYEDVEVIQSSIPYR
ncbi:hypothetical protein ASG99_16730 [Bacillus sp. Soil768D1]|nr:hypothetical protein ASG99_16730 [Bacillus sp. Soil768D1]